MDTIIDNAELIKQKKIAEQMIFNAILDFKRVTGLNIIGIDIKFVEMGIKMGSSQVELPKISVKLSNDQ